MEFLPFLKTEFKTERGKQPALSAGRFRPNKQGYAGCIGFVLTEINKSLRPPAIFASSEISGGSAPRNNMNR
jgi:hypothetical protein